MNTPTIRRLVATLQHSLSKPGENHDSPRATAGVAMPDPTLCVVCGINPAGVSIRTRAEVEVAICGRCWLTIRDPDRVFASASR